jgi:hypothetical protein
LQIAANTLGCLYTQLRKKSCNVYPSDMRIKVPATGFYTFAARSDVAPMRDIQDLLFTGA